jgi:hypothetical protein
VVAVGLWAVVLTAVAVVSERRDRPTVQEQRPLAAAVPAVDRAAGVLLAAVGPDRVVTVGQLTVDPDCPVTPVRAGAEASRDITVYSRAGEAPATLDAIGAALPAGYRAEITHRRGGTVHVLRADAGDFVAVRGSVTGGVITLRAMSGCRPVDGHVPAVGSERAATAPAALSRALAALRLPAPTAPASVSLTCPDGTTAQTVTVDATPAPADLGPALRAETAAATVVEAQPARYAYRTGDTSVVVTVGSGRARVTASTGC